MKQIKRFMILGALTIACFSITSNSYAQTPPPSWKYMTTYNYGPDSGIFYCITTAQSEAITNYPCNICGTLSGDDYNKYWIHLKNNFGDDIISHNGNCFYIDQIDIVVKDVNAIADFPFPDVSNEFISVCNPCKNWGSNYAGNGFTTPWDMSYDNGDGTGSHTMNTPSGCITIPRNTMTHRDYTITFKYPAGGGSCTTTSCKPYRLNVGDHWMVSLNMFNSHKLTLKVHAWNTARTSEFTLNGVVTPLVFTDFQNAATTASCPDCTQCATTCPTGTCP